MCAKSIDKECQNRLMISHFLLDSMGLMCQHMIRLIRMNL